ncbi:MAG: alanine racemase [Phycisphaeraceae bacterium]
MAARDVHSRQPAPPGPSWLEIDLDRLESNAATLLAALQTTGGPRLCAVVKKNAYGLGVGPIAHRLARVGCCMLAVYTPEEAEQLVTEGPACPLLLMMPLRHIDRAGRLHRAAMAGRLHLSVHSAEHFERIAHIGRSFGMKLPVHLYLDTGMSRGGLSDADLRQIVGRLPGHRYVQLAGIYSHLATADLDSEYAHRQYERFSAAVDAAELPAGVTRHLANTCATMRDPRYHLDLVRVGLGLLGYGPRMLVDPPAAAALPDVRPIMRWMSRIVDVHRYPAGSSVGYGQTHRLGRASLLGVVPVGYGDGYPLGLSNKASVRIRPAEDAPWHEAPVLGRVNMDQIVVDLTDLETAMPGNLVGADVEVISNDPDAPNALEKLAELAGSHCYEMLCRLSSHLPRRYRR